MTCTRAAEPDDAAFRAQVGAFIDTWHDDAAHGRPAYFDKMAPDGVYIGTDKTEYWQREAFRVWAKPYFDKGSAWDFKAIKRNIYFSPDRQWVWWDEQLNTQMGICQASGVMRVGPEGMAIQHYQLSLTVPNGALDKVQTVINDSERSGL
ncbi:nuclear transport factor 2 family protein [Duganella sp. P38]|uniref:nuclear transport factor 2 family protein n=1 Tax=Duganella sp. P38 TaxID=3423949 RepID=UPI003D7BD941